MGGGHGGGEWQRGQWVVVAGQGRRVVARVVARAVGGGGGVEGGDGGGGEGRETAAAREGRGGLFPLKRN